jgi:hypothetical protein
MRSSGRLPQIRDQIVYEVAEPLRLDTAELRCSRHPKAAEPRLEWDFHALRDRRGRPDQSRIHAEPQRERVARST